MWVYGFIVYNTEGKVMISNGSSTDANYAEEVDFYYDLTNSLLVGKIKDAFLYSDTHSSLSVEDLPYLTI